MRPTSRAGHIALCLGSTNDIAYSCRNPLFMDSRLGLRPFHQREYACPMKHCKVCRVCGKDRIKKAPLCEFHNREARRKKAAISYAKNYKSVFKGVRYV